MTISGPVGPVTASSPTARDVSRVGALEPSEWAELVEPVGEPFRQPGAPLGVIVNGTSK